MKRRGRQPKPHSLFSPISVRRYWPRAITTTACLRDYDTAVRYFEQARQFLPNSSRIPEIARLCRAEARPVGPERVVLQRSRAARPAQRSPTHRARSSPTCVLRRFPEALRKLDQVLDITPDDVDTLMEKAAIAQAEGDLPRAAALLAPLHPSADDSQARWKHKFTKRSWSAALHQSSLG